eukprot:TRINITY_DN11631_c0_g1_i4.p1 TRINITY_DN11631_c0_g1~~TRINITY_DN11631_c0_g1_i4.p1  ORF type:complete len:199 (+),score=30.53 TRINITY_DN11631_c0_g1_i4:67-597(+)
MAPLAAALFALLAPMAFVQLGGPGASVHPHSGHKGLSAESFGHVEEDASDDVSSFASIGFGLALGFLVSLASAAPAMAYGGTAAEEEELAKRGYSITVLTGTAGVFGNGNTAPQAGTGQFYNPNNKYGEMKASGKDYAAPAPVKGLLLELGNEQSSKVWQSPTVVPYGGPQIRNYR